MLRRGLSDSVNRMARIRANDPAARAHWRGLANEFSESGWYHSIELPDGQVLEGLQSLEQQKERLRRLPVPDDLSGKRVLDIGTWDGWFAFEMERRGADVTAIDSIEQPAFYLARDRLGAKVDYRVMDVYQLSAKTDGRFDLVLFLGVLYHLKHPLLGLEKVCEVTRDTALVESYVIDEGLPADGQAGSAPVMEFYEEDELANRLDNWVGPNTACLLALCRAAGFARVKLLSVIEQRAHVACYRHWDPEPDSPTQPRPVLSEALNLRTAETHFESRLNDYVSLWFEWSRVESGQAESGGGESDAPELEIATVFPEIGGYGVRPIFVGRKTGNAWQVNCKLPPGLAPGPHQVRVRTAGSIFSDPVEIVVDGEPRPIDLRQLKIVSVTDAETFDENRVWLGKETWASLWVEGLPASVRREHLKVRFGEAALAVSYVGPADKDGYRQVNVQLHPSTVPGEYPVAVSCGGAVSAPVPVRVSHPDEAGR